MITVEGITKRFGSLVAVDKLSFEIDRGQVVGFLGPNGAGKTTTMRMITGTLQPDEGRILMDGQSIGDERTQTKQRIGYLPESNPLYEDMLVCDYLEFAGRLRGLSGATLRKAIKNAADETGIEAVFYRPIGEASKGYRQRIGLTAALLHSPEILVLDEPTEGLDPNQRVEIRRLVKVLGRERTILLSTHVMQEVEATCDRLLIINRGALVADGSVADLLAEQRNLATYVVEAKGENIAPSLASLPGVQRHTVEQLQDRVRVVLLVKGTDDPRPQVFAMANERGWTLWELHRERANLEALFRELTVTIPAAEDKARNREAASRSARKAASGAEEGRS